MDAYEVFVGVALQSFFELYSSAVDAIETEDHGRDMVLSLSDSLRRQDSEVMEAFQTGLPSGGKRAVTGDAATSALLRAWTPSTRDYRPAEQKEALAREIPEIVSAISRTGTLANLSVSQWAEAQLADDTCKAQLLKEGPREEGFWTLEVGGHQLLMHSHGRFNPWRRSEVGRENSGFNPWRRSEVGRENSGDPWWGTQLVVPASLQPEVLDLLHNSAWSSHPGTPATQDAVSRHFWWAGWQQSVADWVAKCLTCQRYKG